MAAELVDKAQVSVSVLGLFRDLLPLKIIYASAFEPPAAEASRIWSVQRDSKAFAARAV